MKINMPIAVRAGLIGAAASVVAALLTRIPFLGCLLGWLGTVVALAIGALYVYLRREKVDLVEGAAGGAVAGAIAGAVYAFLRGLLDMIFSHGGFFGALLLPLILGIIFGAIAGAIGGLIWAAITGSRK
jgi:hypothetical protein